MTGSTLRSTVFSILAILTFIWHPANPSSFSRVLTLTMCALVTLSFSVNIGYLVGILTTFCRYAQDVRDGETSSLFPAVKINN